MENSAPAAKRQDANDASEKDALMQRRQSASSNAQLHDNGVKLTIPEQVNKTATHCYQWLCSLWERFRVWGMHWLRWLLTELDFSPLAEHPQKGGVAENSKTGSQPQGQQVDGRGDENAHREDRSSTLGEDMRRKLEWLESELKNTRNDNSRLRQETEDARKESVQHHGQIQGLHKRLEDLLADKALLYSKLKTADERNATLRSDILSREVELSLSQSSQQALQLSFDTKLSESEALGEAPAIDLFHAKQEIARLEAQIARELRASETTPASRNDDEELYSDPSLVRSLYLNALKRISELEDRNLTLKGLVGTKKTNGVKTEWNGENVRPPTRRSVARPDHVIICIDISHGMHSVLPSVKATYKKILEHAFARNSQTKVSVIAHGCRGFPSSSVKAWDHPTNASTDWLNDLPNGGTTDYFNCLTAVSNLISGDTSANKKIFIIGHSMYWYSTKDLSPVCQHIKAENVPAHAIMVGGVPATRSAGGDPTINWITKAIGGETLTEASYLAALPGIFGLDEPYGGVD
ncbi:Uu.00g020350.m01.CDS01 [Anthostomella pinea]|uniref:Uu.00g020350.m01.CDS01 n=1 Tax=Anthostomella pinea TaxID=933095 RepID=A0AAI8VTM5_9PEZI|nr:Uu.00g020350.m01.CDS01 [Anthostomella pinea]